MVTKTIKLQIPLLLLASTLFQVRAQTASELAAVYADLSVFESPLAGSLKKGVTKKAIERIQNDQLKETARQLLAGQYDKQYRFASYEAYLTPTTLGHHLMIGDGYSKYENMTGIYLPLGKHVVLVDGIAQGQTVNLLIPNWNRRAPEGI